MKLSNGNWRNAAVFTVLLMGLILAGCSRRESLPGIEENAADQHLPFEGTSDKAGNFPTGSPSTSKGATLELLNSIELTWKYCRSDGGNTVRVMKPIA